MIEAVKVYYSEQAMEKGEDFFRNHISEIEAEYLEVDTKGLRLATMAELEVDSTYCGEIETADGIFEYDFEKEMYVQLCDEELCPTITNPNFGSMFESILKIVSKQIGEAKATALAH